MASHPSFQASAIQWLRFYSTSSTPNPYPIIDYRALWSLGLEQKGAYYTFDDWWTYVESCRDLSEQAGVDMRTFDRALWQYSKESQSN